MQYDINLSLWTNSADDPAGTQRWKNVDSMLIQRQDVESTLFHCEPTGDKLIIFFLFKFPENMLWHLIQIIS